MTTEQLIAIVGPTASGKSDLAIDLVQSLPGAGVIVNADSMQLYRGLDIGTAKTPLSERRGIPHLLLDVLEVEEEASVAKFQTEARRVIREQWREGSQPAIAGGSALYLRAVLDELEFPGTSPALREELEREVAVRGSAALHAELTALDWRAAQNIHPNNARRIVRALEVIRLTGKPFTATLPSGEYHFPHTVQLAIDWDLEELDRRIEERTRAIFSAGIVDEVRRLVEAGHVFGKTAALATGYGQALAVMRGELKEGEAVEQVALATRQLARRQLKWFRRDSRIHWLQPDAKIVASARQAIADKLR